PTFTQLPGSAWVANGRTGWAMGAIGSSTMNGLVAGLDGSCWSAKTRRRDVGPSRLYALLASPIFRMSRLVSIVRSPSWLNFELRHHPHVLVLDVVAVEDEAACDRSRNAERRNVGPSKPYVLPAKPALRISRL